MSATIGIRETALVHLGAGIGNVVLATPLLTALNEIGFVVDLMLEADYKETAELFRDWSSVRAVLSDRSIVTGSYRALVPALPPFYWKRFERIYARERRARCVDHRIVCFTRTSRNTIWHLRGRWDTQPIKSRSTGSRSAHRKGTT